MPLIEGIIFSTLILGSKPSYAAKVDAYFNGLLLKNRLPSISLAIVRDGKVEYAKGYGFADLENDVKAEPDTVYRLGSITKQFTATMILQLVREGKLSLDDHPQKYLTGLPSSWSDITVTELLNHTSGIRNYTEMAQFIDLIYKPVKPVGILEPVLKEPLDFVPGTKWHYSNSGYEVLGMLIEKLDGRSYEASLKARILDPLEMHQTYFTSESKLVKHRAQGYTLTAGALRHAQYLNMDWPFAAGSMESTVLDLAKWDAALYGSKILPQDMLQKQMWTPLKLKDGTALSYGFGWALGSMNGIQMVEHSGGIFGFSTDIRRVPSHKLTVIVFANSDIANPAEYTQKTLGLIDTAFKNDEATGPAKADPQLDAVAEAFLKAEIQGQADRTKLTPEFNKALTQEMLDGIKAQLASQGDPVDFKLVGVTSRKANNIRSYHFKLGRSDYKLMILFTPSGLIAGALTQPGD